MRFVKSVFNRFLGFLCSLFGLPFLYSCDEGLGIFVTEGVAAYGMPPNWGYISGTVTGDSNGDGTATPLANVKIYADSENTVYSADESGLVSITNDRGKFHIDLYKEEHTRSDLRTAMEVRTVYSRHRKKQFLGKTASDLKIKILH